MRLRLSLLALLVLLVVPAEAAASGRDVLRDCADDEVLSKAYTQKEYRDALSEIATDSSEYSDCESIIRRAQLTAAAGASKRGGSGGGSSSTGGGGGTGGGSAGGSGPGSSGAPSSGAAGDGAGGGTVSPATPATPLTPDDQQALEQARASGGEGIEAARALAALPGASRAPTMTGDGGLPGPVTGLLILLAGTLVFVTAARLRTRVLGRRPA